MESDVPVVDSQRQLETEPIVLSAVKESSLPGVLPDERYRDLLQSHEANHAQAVPARLIRRRRRPSSSVWRLIVILGDSSILIPLLVWFAKPTLTEGLEDSTTSYLWVFLAFVAWTLAANAVQAQELDRISSRLKSPLSALCSLFLMLIFLAVLFYIRIGGNQIITYAQPLVIFLVLATFLLTCWRVFMAEVINLPAFRHRAVIVGVNKPGKEVAAEVMKIRHRSIDVIGYIRESSAEPEFAQGQLNGLPVLGGTEALRHLVEESLIEKVIMAIDYKENQALFRVALEGAQQNITLMPAAAVYEDTSGKIPLEHLGDQWYMALPEHQFLSPFYIGWRKAIDLVFGLSGLVLLGLVLPILGLLIKLDSRGSIFYSQERAGYRGRTFRILKFRSMYTPGERTVDGVWTSKGDARVTRVGRFMRATHLDELPQMLNIVRGEMSLIGPRPERPDYVAELAEQSNFYNYRLSVKPGLTGWAQVKYGYGTSEQDELVKLQYDLFYIKHQSYILDILILLKTVIEVVLFHGV